MASDAAQSCFENRKTGATCFGAPAFFIRRTIVVHKRRVFNVPVFVVGVILIMRCAMVLNALLTGNA